MGKLFSKPKSATHGGYRQKASNAKESSSHGPARDMSRHNPVHDDAVVSLAAVQTGLCLSGSKDKHVVLYDYHNSRVEDRWIGHEREITKVIYGAGCHAVFSASRDKTVKMWQRGKSHVLRTFEGHELVVTAIALNKDNTQLCSGSRDNSLRLWDVETGTSIRQNNIAQNLVTDVKWIGDTPLIVQAGEDKEVRYFFDTCPQSTSVYHQEQLNGGIFDTRNFDIVHRFPRKQYIQMCVDASGDQNYCLTCSNGSGGNGCEATLWDLRAHRLVHEFKGHSEAVEACIFLPNPERPLVATCSRDCNIKIWDRDTQECVSDKIISGSGPLTSLMAYENGSICVGSFNLGIQLLEVSPSDNYNIHQKAQF